MSKKKILLLSDDLRMNSGIATVSRDIVLSTVDTFDWIQAHWCHWQLYPAITAHGELWKESMENYSPHRFDEKITSHQIHQSEAISKCKELIYPFYHTKNTK